MLQFWSIIKVRSLKPPLHKECDCSATAKTSKKAQAIKPFENESGKTFGIDKNGEYATIKTADTLMDDENQEYYFAKWNGKVEKQTFSKKEDIDDRRRITKFYGGEEDEWEKCKRNAVMVDTQDAETCALMNGYTQDKDGVIQVYDEYGKIFGLTYEAEIHWYEQRKIGKVEYKIKKKPRAIRKRSKG